MKQAEKMQEQAGRQTVPAGVLEDVVSSLEQMDEEQLRQVGALVQGMRLARMLGSREAV